MKKIIIVLVLFTFSCSTNKEEKTAEFPIDTVLEKTKPTKDYIKMEAGEQMNLSEYNKIDSAFFMQYLEGLSLSSDSTKKMSFGSAGVRSDWFFVDKIDAGETILFSILEMVDNGLESALYYLNYDKKSKKIVAADCFAQQYADGSGPFQDSLVWENNSFFVYTRGEGTEADMNDSTYTTTVDSIAVRYTLTDGKFVKSKLYDRTYTYNGHIK